MTGGLPRLVDAISTPENAPTPALIHTFLSPS